METNVGMQRQESGSPKELAGTRAQKTPEAAAEFDYRELGEAEAGLASEHKEEVPEEVNAPEAAAEFDYRELGEAEAGPASEHKEEVPEEVNAPEAAAEFDYRELGEAEAGPASEHKEEVPEEVNAPEAAAEFDYRELGEAEAGLASEHKEEVPEEVNAPEAAAEFDYRELAEAEAGLASEHKEEVPEEVNAPEAAAEFDYRELGEAAAQEFEESSSASGAAPVRRSSIRFVLASIEEKENELKELEAREKAVESQLQVYSEVIGLRKELRLVKEETERVRQQLDSINVFAEKYGNAVERDLNSAEEEAQRSHVQQVWTSVCRERPNESLGDPSSWTKVDLDNLSRRVEAARGKLQAASNAAAKVYASQEEMINKNTEERDKAKAKLLESAGVEMSKLVETRSRLKQLDDDQRYHFRRGTHVKQRHVSSLKEQDIMKGRVYKDESRQFGDVVLLEDECKDLTEWVNGAKRELEDNKRSYAKEQSELEEQLQVMEDNGKEARELRAFFERENDQLKGLKQDLQRVMLYARARHHELLA
ncbi:hypothetical protein BCY84_17411 [Trypanosoma cruzi cruzi]|nr:hypothetical protein BCY84_17411 [Trypanosoma cruzi cruzi]